MRVAVTGGAGFIGRAVVERLTARGDTVVALVRDPARAGHLVGDRTELVRSSLDDPAALRAAVEGADAVVHIAGSYRIGIGRGERDAMREANVGATERVLDAAMDAGVPRILYTSTLNVLGDSNGRIVDETHVRDLARGFLSFYDETKYLAHEAALARIRDGAPIVIGMPGQTYGPHDHSLASLQLERAHHGTLRYVSFATAGIAWVHVHDLADGLVAALDRGRVGEAYSLGGDCRRMGESVEIAAAIGGRRRPRLTVPTGLLRIAAPLNDALGGLPGMPANLREVISASDGVTYWAGHAKAERDLGFTPRGLPEGIADTWGRADRAQARAPGR
jgi:dihydroflavonol-4-reductase